jgi:hypothetical protein
MPGSEPGTRWEYEEFGLDYSGDWSSTLSQYGLKGWELVSVVHDEASSLEAPAARFVLKRPLLDESRAEPRKTDLGTDAVTAQTQGTAKRRGRPPKKREESDE